MTDYIAENPLPFEQITVGTRVSVPDWRNGRIVGHSNGTVTQEQGTEVDATGAFIVQVDSTSSEVLHFGYSIAAPVVLPQYTVLTHTGLGDNPWPEAPSRENTVATLAAARDLFRRWMRDSGNDYLRREGYDQPWADIVRTESWDGISYGDITGGDGVERLVRGTLGGVVRESF